jgi:uncharacterized membrane protein
MTLKQYTVARLVIAMVLAAFIASSVVRGDYLWPIVAMVAAMLLLLIARRRVKEVIADERDYAIGGRAALWAIQIFCMGAVLLMFVLHAKRGQYPEFGAVASTLAYGSCILMLLYSVLFRWFRRRSP